MKKLILFSLSGLLVLVLFSMPKATAQNFHIVASFGTTHAWNVPVAIEYEIYDYYPYHNWVHVDRVIRGRRVFYNILLERDGFYTELQFGNHFRLMRTQYYVDYPLYNHFCSGHCGYHNAYFNSHRVVNNHYYYGGHNHYVYQPQPRYMNHPVRPQSVRYTEYGNRNRNNRVVSNDTRVVRSNSSTYRSEPARVNNNSRSNNKRNAVSNRSNVNSNANRSVRNTTSNEARTVRSTSNNARVERAPQSRSTRTVNSAPAKRESSAVSNRSTTNNSRSTGTRVASNRKASSPAVSNNSRSSSSRSATTTSRTSSSNGRGSGRGN